MVLCTLLRKHLVQGVLPGVPNQPPSIDNAYNLAENLFNKVMLPLLGMAVVGALIYAGVMRMMAGDNAQNVAKANAALFWAIVGTVIILLSIVIVRVFKEGILGIT